MKTLLKFACGVTFFGLPGTAFADDADIRFTVTNVEEETGQILASLCTEDAYLAQRYDQCTGIRFDAREGGTGIFKSVAAGTYSITLFHDLDGDNQLKTGGQGIPLEPLGSSNDARGTFGPPSFDDLAISHSDKITELTITLYRVGGR